MGDFIIIKLLFNRKPTRLYRKKFKNFGRSMLLDGQARKSASNNLGTILWKDRGARVFFEVASLWDLQKWRA
jgi:hypothetical protein